MNESIESYRNKIEGAQELGSVVRTMKALAVSGIGQYERAVHSLKDYYRTVELGIAACLQHQPFTDPVKRASGKEWVHVVVFGSDQGLVGQFNEQIAAFTLNSLSGITGRKRIWAVGERVASRLQEAGCAPVKTYNVPNSVHAITPLVTQILLDTQAIDNGTEASLYIMYHEPKSGALHIPVCRRLLPLDHIWQDGFRHIEWPTSNVSEVLGNKSGTLAALIREYLFVSLFKASAESLASENASRMESMQRAEKNINELLEDLTHTFNRLRQNRIDEELFDVLSGFEALMPAKHPHKPG